MCRIALASPCVASALLEQGNVADEPEELVRAIDLNPPAMVHPPGELSCPAHGCTLGRELPEILAQLSTSERRLSPSVRAISEMPINRREIWRGSRVSEAAVSGQRMAIEWVHG